MTSEMGEAFNELRRGKRALRDRFGVECPKCKEQRPKTNASILLPGQRCRVDGYIDPRSRTTLEQRNALFRELGINLIEQP